MRFYSKNFENLTPKGPLFPVRIIENLGNVPWCQFYKKIETYCEHVLQNKLRVSTIIFVFGHMDNKLWRNENFGRNQGHVRIEANHHELIRYAQKGG
jgi:hypothetical protein